MKLNGNFKNKQVMKRMNILILTLTLLLSVMVVGQERIVEKQNEVLHLKTMDFEVIKSDDGSTYYSHTLYSGYKYPKIKEGFYIQNIFVNGDGLINFYKELIKISKMEDGKYKLSKEYGDVSKVNKKRNKIKMYFITYYNYKPYEGTNAMGIVGTVKIKFLEEDLKKIENYINN